MRTQLTVLHSQIDQLKVTQSDSVNEVRKLTANLNEIVKNSLDSFQANYVEQKKHSY